MANEFIIRKGYKSLASSEITGSLLITGSNISLVGADTPFLTIKDTTNDLTGKIRVANSYVYIEADQGNSVGSTRLVLKTDGTQFLYGDANQNVFIPTGDVGIGTTTADEKLHVQGNIKFEQASGDIDVRYTSNGTNKYNMFYQAATDGWGLYYNPGSAYRLFINSSGNVGIGTNNPEEKLHVSGTTKTSTLKTGAGSIVITGQEIYANDEYTGNDGAIRLNRFGYQGGQTRFRDVDIFDGKGTSIMKVDGSSGNVGIGTTSPTSKLHVNGAISGSDTYINGWNSVSASLSTLTTDLDVLENKNLLSGSAQIASDISGSITSFSGSIAGRVATNESSISSLNGATGSYLLNTTDTLTGNLTVTGTLTAQEFHTEFVSASILFDSGSTKFGDTSDDNHDFTGSVNILSGSATINAAGDTTPLTIQGSSHKYLDITTTTNNQVGIRMTDDSVTYIMGLHGGEDAFKISKNSTFGTNDYFNIDANGKVGIGTVTPSELLSVQGNVSASAFYGDGSNLTGLVSSSHAEYADNSTSASHAEYADNSTSASHAEYADNAGTLDSLDSSQFLRSDTGDTMTGVLSMTSTSAIPLTVKNGNSSYTAISIANTGSGQAGVYMDASNGDFIGSDYAFVGQTNDKHLLLNVGSSGGDIIFEQYGGERMRIKEGKVGIGTTNPSEELHIVSTSPGVRLQDSDGTDTFGRTHFSGASLYFYSRNNTSNGNFIWIGSNGTADTEFMRLDNAGSLLFGPNSAYQRVIFDPTPSTVLGNGTLTITPSTSPGSGTAQFYTRFLDRVGGGTTKHNVIIDGKLGVGTTAPTKELHVAGEISGSDLYIDAWGSVSASLTSIATAGGVNGSGTTNDIAMWSAANTLTDAPIAISGNNATFAGDVTITGGDLTLGTDSIASNINAVGDVLAFKVDSNENTGGTPNIQFKVGAATELTINGSSATFAGDITTNGDITIDNSSGDPFLKLKTTAQEYVARIDQSDSEKFQIRDTTNSATRLTIDTSGNVGIGNTSPQSTLDVTGTITLSSDTEHQILKSTSNSYGLGGGETTEIYGRNILLSAYDDVVLRAGTSDEIRFFAGSSGAARMMIDADGDVGIGTSTPSRKLTVGNTTALTGNMIALVSTGSSGAYTQIGFGDETDDNKGQIIYVPSSGTLQLQTGGGGVISDRGLTLDSSENVGIGTSTPGAALDVHGRVDFANDFRLRGSDATADLGVIRFYVDNTDKLFIDAGNDGNNLFTINSSGNVGIGTTSVDGKLDVHGTYGRWRVNGYGGMYFRNDSNSTHENYIHARSNGDLSIGRVATGSLTGTGVDTYAGTTHDQIHINTNGTIELPAYGAGYLKADANGVITSDSVVDDAANADTVDSKHATDFTLDYVTGNGSSTSNSIQVGDLEVQNSGIPILTLDDNGNSGGGGAQGLIRFKNNAGIMSGIGTTDDETDNSDLLISTNANSTYGGYLGLQTAGITDTQADIVLDALSNIILAPESGSVGIGTSSPAKPLHVRTTGAGEQIISIFENSENADETKASIQLRNATNDVCSTKIISHRTGANFGADLTFELSDDVDGSFQERMRITETGRVGIGTTSPSSLLHLESASTPSLQLTDTSQTTTLKLYAQDSNTHIANITSHDMVFDTANTEKMRITAAGNVGIGTDSPVDNYASGITPETTKLAVYGGTSSGYTEVAHFAAGSDANDTGATVRIGHVGNDRGMFIKAGRGTSDQAKALLGIRNSGNTDETILTMQQGGNVGIGDSTPSYKLDVAGTGRFTSNLLVEGTLTETSAKRFKENIQPLESQLENIEKLNPVSFDWKKDGKSDIGLIAEEVKEIIPTLVSEEDGEVKGIQYTKLTAILIKAVQEQQKQINELKEEIFILKKK